MRDRPFAGGLRSRLTAMFALGALGLALALSISSYVIARESLIDQRERSALRQALSNAALVRDRLLSSGQEVSDVLGDLAPPRRTTVFLRRGGEWYSTALELSADDITRSVQPGVTEGSVTRDWTEAGGTHGVVVGIPLPAVDAEYFEVTVAEELNGTLATLRLTLIGCGLVTVALGAALGRWASARALQPLDQVAQVAARISAGDMEARLADTGDPDLAAFVGAFNNMVETVEERIMRDARFAADVSHELRTPLTTLITSLGVLQSRPDLTGPSAEAVDLMARELERFRRALEDLLVLGRLEAEASFSGAATVALPDLARQALISTHRPLTLLQAPGDAAAPFVTVDPPQLVRAIVNLLENADLHGGGVSAVRVLARNGFAEVHVEDRGPGVDPADRIRIFERFVRAGARGSVPGTGLGLSIVAQTVRNHRGSTWYADRPGGGAAFVIRLPRAEQA